MPTNKDFKRLVRARMQKTGEAYTAARAKLLRKLPTSATVSQPVAAARAEPAATDYAKLAGMSDAAIKKATGCTWDRWTFALDHYGAEDLSHRAIAEHVQNTYKVSDWWAQTVTVGYERIKGLREIGQRRNGGYEATKSKTVNAPASAVFRAFAHARVRKAWLPEKVMVRKATPNRSVRMTWDDGSSVEVWITAKGRKTSAQVAHRKLAGKEDADRRKAFWADRLTALSELTER